MTIKNSQGINKIVQGKSGMNLREIKDYFLMHNEEAIWESIKRRRSSDDAD